MFGKFRYVAKNVTKDDVTFSRDVGLKHTFSVPFKISQKKAKKLQDELRYHPDGYGFFDFKQVHTKTHLMEWRNGKLYYSQETFETSWSCSYDCN